MSRTVTVPAAKAALIARLEALQATGKPLADVGVLWGLPAELPDGRENVYLTRTVSFDRVGTPGNIRVEQYGLELVVEVHDVSETTPRSAEERMWTIVAAIEVELLRSPALAGADVRGVVPADELTYAYADGFFCRTAVRVDLGVVLQA